MFGQIFFSSWPWGNDKKPKSQTAREREIVKSSGALFVAIKRDDNGNYCHCVSCLFPDCSGRNPLDGPLKGELETALAMAERFTQQYNSLLRRLEERMANTSLILDLLNREFGWVSSLANRTNTKDNFFQIQTVCMLFHLLVDTGEQIEDFSVTFPSLSLVIVLIICKQAITKTIFEKEQWEATLPSLPWFPVALTR